MTKIIEKVVIALFAVGCMSIYCGLFIIAMVCNAEGYKLLGSIILTFVLFGCPYILGRTL